MIVRLPSPVMTCFPDGENIARCNFNKSPDFAFDDGTRFSICVPVEPSNESILRHVVGKSSWRVASFIQGDGIDLGTFQ